jgi:hypothetical protein
MNEFFEAIEKHEKTATILLIAIIFIAMIIADGLKKSKKE